MTFSEFISAPLESLKFKVDKEIYHAFQKVSGDFNPMHTDPMFAGEFGFDGPVMYGNILNAFISYFVGMALPSRRVMIISQDINFHKPVFMNDEIVLKPELESFSESTRTAVYKILFLKETDKDKFSKIAKAHVQIRIML